jgi:hypothetical protein
VVPDVYQMFSNNVEARIEQPNEDNNTKNSIDNNKNKNKSNMGPNEGNLFINIVN